jgi:hypothetical protein
MKCCYRLCGLICIRRLRWRRGCGVGIFYPQMKLCLSASASRNHADRRALLNTGDRQASGFGPKRNRCAFGRNLHGLEAPMPTRIAFADVKTIPSAPRKPRPSSAATRPPVLLNSRTSRDSPTPPNPPNPPGSSNFSRFSDSELELRSSKSVWITVRRTPLDTSIRRLASHAPRFADRTSDACRGSSPCLVA